MTVRQVGTVEILRQRNYPLDPEGGPPLGTEVLVEPGVFPLYEIAGSTRFWVMTGRINEGGVRRMGDGMILGSEGDDPSGVEVRFPSRRLGPIEFAELLGDPICLEGDPEQRLCIKLEP